MLAGVYQLRHEATEVLPSHDLTPLQLAVTIEHLVELDRKVLDFIAGIISETFEDQRRGKLAVLHLEQVEYALRPAFENLPVLRRRRRVFLRAQRRGE